MKEEIREIFNNVNEWLKFAEAKNFGLLSLTAAIVFGFLQIEFAKNSSFEQFVIWTISIVAFLSFFPSILSLFPIVSKIEKGENLKNWISTFSNWIDKETSFENIHFYGYLRSIDTVEFERKFLNKLNIPTQSLNQYEKELVGQILYNSRITWLKYQLFKIGAFFFLVGFLVFLPLGLLIFNFIN
jgi:hypothetical protein